MRRIKNFFFATNSSLQTQNKQNFLHLVLSDAIISRCFSTYCDYLVKDHPSPQTLPPKKPKKKTKNQRTKNKTKQKKPPKTPGHSKQRIIPPPPPPPLLPPSPFLHRTHTHTQSRAHTFIFLSPPSS